MANQKTWMKTRLNGLIAAVIGVACVALLLALRVFADANMGLRLSKDPRLLATTTGILGALLLGGLGLLAMLVVALAILHHTETIRAIANQVAQDQAAGIQVTDENWKRMVEQVAADVLPRRVSIVSFADMDSNSATWIRFVIGGGRGISRGTSGGISRDDARSEGRVIVFATSRRVLGCKGWGSAIDDAQHPHAVGELRAIWNYFAHQSGHDVSLARDCTWFVFPLQSSQDIKRSGLFAQLAWIRPHPVLGRLRSLVQK